MGPRRSFKVAHEQTEEEDEKEDEERKVSGFNEQREKNVGVRFQNFFIWAKVILVCPTSAKKRLECGRNVASSSSKLL